MATLNIRPSRMIAPPQGRAALELVQFPMYSCAILDASASLPRQIGFFNYAIGQAVSTNATSSVNATRFDTSMETANFLAAPKTFTVEQIRIVISQTSYASNAPAATSNNTSAAATPSPILNDIQLIGSGAFRFFVGPKDYVQTPLWAVSANAGVSGVADVSISSTASAYGGLIATTPYVCGRPWTIKTWPVLIANQQSFGAEILSQFAQAAGNQLSAVRRVWCVLEGVLGREVS